MQVVIVKNADELGRRVADRIVEGTRNGSIRVLGVATGSSPLPVYANLRERPSSALAGLHAFALDEYVGIPLDHPESYHAVIHREVTEPLGLDPAHVHVPDGLADNLKAAADAYDAAIAADGGIDLQILGIGTTGHIGFNEPTSSFASRTRVKTLAPASRVDNARFFDSPDEVPIHCVTQGLGTILDARGIVLVAHGRQKAHAVAAAIEGPITSMCPGSALQLHPDVTFVLDEEAASELTLQEYYRFVEANLPELPAATAPTRSRP